MRLDERIEGNVTILTVRGEFDARTLPVATERLDSLLSELRSRVVFNLARLEIVTSTAIGFLVDATKRTRNLGGDLVISEPTRLFRSAADTLRMGSVLNTAESDEQALEHFRKLDEEPEPPPDEPPAKRGWFFRRKN